MYCNDWIKDSDSDDSKDDILVLLMYCHPKSEILNKQIYFNQKVSNEECIIQCSKKINKRNKKRRRDQEIINQCGTNSLSQSRFGIQHDHQYWHHSKNFFGVADIHWSQISVFSSYNVILSMSVLTGKIKCTCTQNNPTQF